MDLTTGIAGPLATMFFADFDADVVKVEPPSGDPARAEPGFAVWNRGKRGIVVDPDRAADVGRLTELVRGADLLVVNDLDGGVGIDVDAARTANPGLVVLDVPPYAGPTPWATGKESQGLLSAITGFGLRQSSWDGGPIESVSPGLLYSQGIWAATCATAALVERESSGHGQVVTVSGIHGVLQAGTMHLTLDPTAPPLVANLGPGGPAPNYTRYRCADGEWMFVAALSPKFQASLLVALDVEDILDDERIAGRTQNMLLPDNRGWVRKRIEQVCATRTRDDWLERLRQADVPGGPLLSREDWLDDPQIEAIGMRASVEDPERGTVLMPGVPTVLTGSPGAVRGPAPRLGEHDAEVRPWPPRPAPTGPPPEPTPGPLHGYRIVELGAFLAGPYSGHLLAELGARVTKVEPPTGDVFRMQGFTCNRGKEGVVLDLRTDEGRAAFARLIDHADAVTDNYRLGVLEQLRVTYADLAAVKPDIIALSITGYGEGGPQSPLPGFDPVLQAASGMMSAQGGDDEPVFHTIAVNDMAGAVLCAFAVTAALLHRQRTGDGQRIWTSLAGTSALMQSGELVRYAGRPPAPVGGRDYAGREPLRRYYAAADGWVRVDADAAEADPARLSAAGFAGFDAGSAAVAGDAVALDAALEAALSTVQRDDAVRRLTTAGVPAAPARYTVELLGDQRLAAAETFHEHRLPDGRPYVTAGRFANFSRTQRTDVLVPPGLGEHTRATLLDAGLGESDVDGLLATGAAVQGEPMKVELLVNYR